LFGALTAEEQKVLEAQFVPASRRHGETLLCKGEVPDAVFLLTSGTVEMTIDSGGPTRVLLRASPGDSVGMIALIIGGPSEVTATALTALQAYRLDKTGIAAALRERPELGASLEALAKRGLAWLRCEATAHTDMQIERPEMLLTRLRQFLHRLSL
jgi:CRP-like cAMP-binding protein